MEKTFRVSLFLFRRDFRLEDNTGLIFALQSSISVIPAFIFTPQQIEYNPYRSDHCLKFMIESLEDLDHQLQQKNSKLYIFKGTPAEIVKRCISTLHIQALIVNRDYTPYSRHRDQQLQKVCQAHQVAFYSFDDALLHPPENTLKKDGKPYAIFTPYYHNASQQEILPPAANHGTHYFNGSISFTEKPSVLSTILPEHPVKNGLKGGRTEALKILKNLKFFSQYDSLRDFPAADHSTHLSPYLKFTVCSAREVYAAVCHSLSKHHGLIRSLYWRDFFTTIAFFFPHVFQGPFHPQFDKLQWSYDLNTFQSWCNGLTGFPIIDAAMREMNETGCMHNRARMIAASFLIKDLHIDWRWGEKYFAQNLIDYDPALNNGNWQWVAGTGCDAQPFFRIFNPWRQQKKFDLECLYIKKWIPELRHLPAQVIHSWFEEKHHVSCPHYPPPLVKHEKEAQAALHAYKTLTFKGALSGPKL